MIKAKEISIVNLAVFLVLSASVSTGIYFSAHRPVTAAAPVFMGEVLTVERGAGIVKAGQPLSAVRTAVVATVAPLPVSPLPVAAPLPLLPPSVTRKVLPVYPAAALEESIEGSVLLAAYVGTDGRPERIATRRSSGQQDLDAAAVSAVARWRFSPAMQGGQALASWLEIPVRFEIK